MRMDGAHTCALMHNNSACIQCIHRLVGEVGTVTIEEQRRVLYGTNNADTTAQGGAQEGALPAGQVDKKHQ